VAVVAVVAEADSVEVDLAVAEVTVAGNPLPSFQLNTIFQ
jgi:hypothetical protein